MSCIPKSLRPSCLRTPEREPSDKSASPGGSESGRGSLGTSRISSFGNRLSARLKRKESEKSENSRRSNIGSLISKSSTHKNKSSTELSDTNNSDVAFSVPIIDGEEFFKEIPSKKPDLVLGGRISFADDDYILCNHPTHPRSDSFTTEGSDVSTEYTNPSDYFSSDDEDNVGVVQVKYESENIDDFSDLAIPKFNENTSIKKI
jgi:hypothetical protein